MSNSKSPLWKKKSLEQLRADAADNEKGLKPTLGPVNLIALGIGAIIGAGLFVRTAQAAAENAGPAVTLGFVIAAVGCALAGLCYAEFAAMIPIAGSAYTYSYATMGQFTAWIIGWDLVLEYGVGGATVAIAWSEYLNKLLGFFGWEIPFQWCHGPWDAQVDVLGKETGLHGIANLPAVVILAVVAAILIRGIKESALVNGVIVVLKVTIVVLVIVFGWSFINPANHTPYIPAATTYVDNHDIAHSFGGFWGLMGAAGIVFFAFIGFDAVSTAAQETKNPKRDMPIGILGSLAICTVLYILFSHVLTGLASTDDFRNQGKEASVAFAISKSMKGYEWLSKFVTVAILGGFTSVILVMQLGQSRVFYSMSRDRLLPAVFSEIHPRFRTPWKANIILFVFVALFGAFVPGSVVGDMTSIGTLFAFVLVCIGVCIIRRTDPDLPRPFRTPGVPIVPILGALVCLLMILGLGWPNWARLGAWLLVGLVVYFGYGIRHANRAPD
ncbi:MAG TPA: amino acid permease [Planctomycetota bacterium]|nr:amino acid permease [Planctomycetota bacterium]